MSPMRAAPAALTTHDAELRAQYLDEVLGVLYPAPCRAGHCASADTTAVAEYLVVPNARRPRLLVPANDRRVAAAAVRRYAEPTSRMARLKRNAVVAALRTGASALLLRDRVRIEHAPGNPDLDTFERYLQTVVDNQMIALSVHIGPARANRKPVLQLLDANSNTVAFAKLGTTGLTRRLVRAETSSLIALGSAGLTSITIPKVLHAGQWRGHEVLVLAALPTWHNRVPLTTPRLVAAMKEVAGCCGHRHGPLDSSGYATRLWARLDAVADHPDGRQIGAAAKRVFNAAVGVKLVFGAWHGDWAPWNMASLDDTLLVWDWERFTPGVPMGFDALHHDLQRRLEGGDPRAAVDAMLARARSLLLPFGVADRRAVDVTALLYLIELASRYVADRQADAGARLGVLGRWLLPVLLARVEEL